MKTKPTLPQYYVIKRDTSNPLWEKYIEWINKKNKSKWYGKNFDYYGFDGTWSCWSKIKYFENNPQLITLEYWNECVNGQETYTLEQIKEAYKKAAPPNSPLYNKFINKLTKKEEKLEISNWNNWENKDDTVNGTIIFKGKLTQEIVEKIKNLINNLNN